MRDPFHPHEDSAPGGHARSWYAATAKGLKDRPALQDNRRCRVAVIGGGITGCSAALALAEQGQEVIVLDAKRIGWGASGRNGGQLLSGQRVGQATLEDLVGPDTARALWDLAQDAMALVRDRIDRHAIPCDLCNGVLYAATKPNHFGPLQAEAEHLSRHYGYDNIDIVEPDRMADYVASPRYHGGIWDKGGGHLHPLTYTLGLAQAAEDAGATLYEHTPVTALSGDGPFLLKTPSGEIIANTVVLAGNAYALDLIPETSRTILPIHSYVGVTEPLPPEVAQALIPSGGCVSDTNVALDYYRMTPDGRLLMGGGESYGRDLPSPERIRRIIAKRIAHVFPQVDHPDPAYAWGGRLAITMTRMPVIAQPRPGLYLAQGYSGQGLAIATLAGHLMAEALSGRTARFDTYDRVKPVAFPGGRALRHPLMVLGLLMGKLHDALF